MKSLLPQNVYAGEKSTENLQVILKEKNIKKLVIFTTVGIIDGGLLSYLQEYIDKSIDIKIIDNVVPEPSYQEVEEIIKLDDAFEPEMVIGLGGGSVIDTAKLFSILYKSKYSVKDLLDGQEITERKITSVMIPTTCGTGAEATINSIVAIPEKEVKMGIVREKMLPDYVILDPYYIMKLPKDILAATAVDAFCHGIECYTSVKANLLSNIYAKACCELIFANVENAYKNPDDADAKLALLVGSFFGGLAITASGTTAVHALSYPLGGKFHIPHGVSNAILLYDVLRMNQDVIAKELAEISRTLFMNKEGERSFSDTEETDYLLSRIKELVDIVEIPRDLSKWNVTKDDVAFLTTSALEQRRLLDNNKKDLTYEQVESIYLKVI